MDSLVVRIPVCYWAVGERGPGKALRDDKGIVPKRVKEFAQHFWLFSVLCHAIHFSLQLLGGDGPLPVILQGLGVTQVVVDLLFQLLLRHHCIERRLGVSILFWPDAMTPVNVFDSALIRHAFFKSQRSSSPPWRVVLGQCQHCAARRQASSGCAKEQRAHRKYRPPSH